MVYPTRAVAARRQAPRHDRWHGYAREGVTINVEVEVEMSEPSPLEIHDGPRMVRTVAVLQRHVPEPIRSLATVQHVGTLGAAAGSSLGVVDPFRSRRGRKAAGGLPNPAMLVATDTHLHAFAFRPSTRAVKVKRLVATWPRAGVTITAEPGRITTALTLHGPAVAERVRLEATTLGGDGVAHLVRFVNSS